MFYALCERLCLRQRERMIEQPQCLWRDDRVGALLDDAVRVGAVEKHLIGRSLGSDGGEVKCASRLGEIADGGAAEGAVERAGGGEHRVAHFLRTETAAREMAQELVCGVVGAGGDG